MSKTQFAVQTVTEFASQAGSVEGIDLSRLAAGTMVCVNTRHSQYRILVIEPRRGRALVSGAAWFPEPTEVRLQGATAGGSMLKSGWIAVGFKLEMSIGRSRITTSRVISVTMAPTTS